MCPQWPSSRFNTGSSSEQGNTLENSSVWLRCARPTAPLSLGERGGNTNNRRPRCLAGLLELGGEFAAAIDLHSAHS